MFTSRLICVLYTDLSQCSIEGYACTLYLCGCTCGVQVVVLLCSFSVVICGREFKEQRYQHVRTYIPYPGNIDVACTTPDE